MIEDIGLNSGSGSTPVGWKLRPLRSDAAVRSSRIGAPNGRPTPVAMPPPRPPALARRRGGGHGAQPCAHGAGLLGRHVARAGEAEPGGGGEPGACRQATARERYGMLYMLELEAMIHIDFG